MKEIMKGTDPVYLFSRMYPEISLAEEHRRQGLILAGKFSKRLRLSKKAYIATLPEFPEKSPNYDSLGLKVPIIIETRVPWLEAAGLSGIYVTDYFMRTHDYTREQMNAGKVKDWEGINFKMSEMPFTAWVQDGTKFVCRKPSDVRKELSRDENREYVAGPILLAISMYSVRPDLVRTMFWNVIGTRAGSDSAPGLSYWDGGSRFDADYVDDANPRCRALVFGREIRTLNLAT